MFKTLETQPDARDRILKEIRRSKKNGTLVPFIGAGFTFNISTKAAFRSFIEIDLSARLKTPLNTKRLNLWREFAENANEAIEFYIWCMGSFVGGHNADSETMYKEGRKCFHQEVEGKFRSSNITNVVGNEPRWEQHFTLLRKFTTIYTTNWDTTFEIACRYLAQNKKEKINLIHVCNNAADRYGEILKRNLNAHGGPKHTVTLVKYHGCIDVPDSMEATERDFYSRIRREGRIDSDFREVLRHNDILMIGYSLNDVNVKYQMDQINRLSVRNNTTERKIYWLSVDDPTDKNVAKRMADYRRMFLSKCQRTEVCFLFDKLPKDRARKARQTRRKWIEILKNL